MPFNREAVDELSGIRERGYGTYFTLVTRDLDGKQRKELIERVQVKLSQERGIGMVKNLILSTAFCGILLGGVAWAESEGVQVKERSKEVYKNEDGTQVESTSKKKTEVRSDDDSGAASSTETRTESATVKCAEGEEFNEETEKCD